MEVTSVSNRRQTGKGNVIWTNTRCGRATKRKPRCKNTATCRASMSKASTGRKTPRPHFNWHVNSQNLQRPTGAGETLVGNSTTERVWRCAAQYSDGSGGNVPPFGDTEKTPGFCWFCAVVVQYLFKPRAFHTVGKHSTELHPSPQKRF